MLGIDLVKIERINKAHDRFGEGFLKRLLTESEIQNFKNPSSLAGIWAAKEAVSKALGTGIGANLSFLDIEIQKDKSGKPFAVLSDKTAEFFGVKRVEVSISHDTDYAVAAAFIYPPPTN